MYGYIYMTTCDINNKVYVGHRKWKQQYTDQEYSVVDSSEKEWFQKHLGIRAFPIDQEYLGSGKQLLSDIKIYGKSHFHLEVIDVADTREDLVNKESYWISHTIHQGYEVYNLVTNGNTGFDAELMDPERHASYLKSLRQRAKDQNFQSNFGDVSGENNGRYGKPVSNVTKLRISNANKGRVQSKEEREFRRQLHMEKCPEIKPPCRPGVVYVNNGVRNKQLWPDEIDKFLQDNPEWRRGRMSWHKKQSH